jgi:hypothetical protein
MADPRLYRGGNRPRALVAATAEEEAAGSDWRRSSGSSSGVWKAVVFERRHFPNGEVGVGGGGGFEELAVLDYWYMGLVSALCEDPLQTISSLD